MPLRAHLNGKDIFTFDFDTDSWNEFKRRSKHLELQMPCCDSRAVPKTSKLGNSFFSHKAKGDCVSEAESQEHLFIKSVIAQAAMKAGWETTTEKAGKTPAGEQWIADVFCVKGEAKVAFEVQLSKQTRSETLRRQEKYKQSGVRCAWIVSDRAFMKHFYVSDKEVPFFRIGEPKLGVMPTVKMFDVLLTEFIEGMLTGALSWVEKALEYGIYYVDDICWKCSRENKQVCGYTIDWYIMRAKTVPNASTVLKEMLEKIITNDDLIKLGLNSILKADSLKGNANGYPYCNHCLHCGAPQNNYYLMQKIGANAAEEDTEGFEIMVYSCIRESFGGWQFNK